MKPANHVSTASHATSGGSVTHSEEGIFHPLPYTWSHRCLWSTVINTESMSPLPSWEHGQFRSLELSATDDCGIIGIRATDLPMTRWTLFPCVPLRSTAFNTTEKFQTRVHWGQNISDRLNSLQMNPRPIESVNKQWQQVVRGWFPIRADTLVQSLLM